MKKYWFIPLILIVIVVICLLVFKPKNNYELNDSYKLEFNDVLDKPKYLASYNGINVYTKFNVNKYNGNELNKVIDSNSKFVDYIIEKMNYVDIYKDGGSKIYKSSTISNREFYILKCNTANGSREVYILDVNKYYCGD